MGCQGSYVGVGNASARPPRLDERSDSSSSIQEELFRRRAEARCDCLDWDVLPRQDWGASNPSIAVEQTIASEFAAGAAVAFRRRVLIGVAAASVVGSSQGIAPPRTGWPEAVTRLRLPRNVACGFPALRSSEVGLQRGDSLQLPGWEM
jgi:hypothetical protein